jgi:GNAT superfamily N-acetyltransferase
MPIGVRDVDHDTDLAALAALISTAEPQPVTPAMLRDSEARRPPDLVRAWRVAVATDGRIVGASDTGRLPWQAPGHFGLRVIVEPAWREQGIGGRLYEEALAFAQARGATRVETTIADDDPASRRFAERRGFRLDRHIFESVLDLTTFDDTAFAGLSERVTAGGVRLFTLAEVGNTPAAQRRLYALNRETALDQPGSDGRFAAFDDFARTVFTAAWFRPELQALAADGDRWVGLAAVGYFAEHRLAYNMMTGVARDYRGRGIAQALKLAVILGARRCGALTLRTNNDSANAPMLAINRKLGYVAAPGYYRVSKGLGIRG